MASPAPITVPPNYASLSAAQQNAFWEAAFSKFGGIVTAAWVNSNAALKPYQGDTATGMYNALAKAYPNSTPQQRGSTVYQVWIGAGTGQAVEKAVAAGGLALGDVAAGVETAQYLPGWTDSLTALLGDLTSANTWIRVAKVIVGSVMLVVGLAKLTGADSATGIGRIVAKAPLL
jgi:hypothetical protein